MRVIRLPPPSSVWRSAGQIPLGGGCPVRYADGVRRSSASRLSAHWLHELSAGNLRTKLLRRAMLSFSAIILHLLIILMYSLVSVGKVSAFS